MIRTWRNWRTEMVLLSSRMDFYINDTKHIILCIYSINVRKLWSAEWSRVTSRHPMRRLSDAETRVLAGSRRPGRSPAAAANTQRGGLMPRWCHPARHYVVSRWNWFYWGRREVSRDRGAINSFTPRLSPRRRRTAPRRQLRPPADVTGNC